MKVYVMLADGFEEIEALSVVDVLRRGNVDTVSVAVKEDKVVLGAHNIPVVADDKLSQVKVEKDDMIVIPGGGKGVENLGASEELLSLLKEHQSNNGWLAAICAGPMIPGKLGFLKGIKATCYPGCEGNLTEAILFEGNAVVDKNFITGRGPGVSLDFAFAILETIKGKEITAHVKKGMLVE
ncbi:MAG: DJ-1/PfpI family protein [Clostridiaceae bacterium]|nr:DJ-1/PfpI family protein [Clostridiaceae bacterium]